MSFRNSKIEWCSKLFNSFWLSCSDLPSTAFRNDNNKFVVSLFEAIFVVVCEKIALEGLQNRKLSKESLSDLKSDKIFTYASQSNITSTTSVLNRLQRARALIKLK